jgi:hypothetical protein
MNSIFAHITPSKLPFASELKFDRYTFNNIPSYAKISFDQCEKFLNTKSIIIDDEYVHDVMIDDLVDFYNLCKKQFPSHYADSFWFITLIRLFVVYDYCVKNNINKFIHLEYDNLIYSDLKVLDNLKDSIYFTRVGKDFASAGFVYCNNLNNFKLFLECIKKIINKGENFVKTYILPYPMISEMMMISLIKDHTKNIIDYLPILPNGMGSDNFDKLGVLFDGASYGQYIGGTNNGDGVGWAGNHHYVGKMIIDGELKIKFENHKPHAIIDGKIFDILNLHIHSKELINYV